MTKNLAAETTAATESTQAAAVPLKPDFGGKLSEGCLRSIDAATTFPENAAPAVGDTKPAVNEAAENTATAPPESVAQAAS
jgi:hypothetical protein